jgi:hypothetical protein
MAKESLFGQINLPIMVTSSKTTSMVKVSIVGQMDVSTMDSGLTTRWRAKELSLGATAGDTKETTKMIRSMDTVLSSGQMEESI